MVQLVKGWEYNHEELGLDPQHTHKGWIQRTTSLVKLCGASWVANGTEQDTQHLLLTSICPRTHACTHREEHTPQHTHTQREEGEGERERERENQN